MIRDILFVIWFFLPAGLANVAPIFAAKLPYLKTLTFPLDGYVTFRGKRLLGEHKTLRGLISGILVGILIASLQVYLYTSIALVRTFVLIDYAAINPIIFGTLSALGALTGDALKSFFKRQLDRAPGRSWFPFDQVDYVIGGIVFTAFYLRLSLFHYLLLLLIWSLLHPLATCIGYVLKLKDSPI